MSFFSSKKKKESVTVTPSANPAVLSSLNSSINGQNANSTLTNNPSASNSYSRTQRLENTVPNANAPTVHSTNPTLNASTGPVNANVNAPSGIAPPAPSSNISYPWSLRPLHLLPPSPAPPDLSENKTSSLSQLNTLASPSPFPRYGHSVNPLASSPSGELYIFGGLINEQVKSDLYVLQCPPNTPQSTGAGPPGTLSVALVETKGETPGARVGHASVGVGNVLIIWGGDTKTAPEDIQDDGLYLLNLSTREWTRVGITGPAPEGRYGHSAAMVGSRFYVFGGQTDDGSFLNDLWSFDLQKLKAGMPSWTQLILSDPLPPRRTGHTSVTYGDMIYIFGGTDGQYHYNDTWAYDTNNKTWSELQCIGYIPVPREGHAATLVEDVMYVCGGRGVDGKDLEDLAAFRISNQRWYMFQNMGPAPTGRSGHAMATWQNKVYVLGGESYTTQRTDNPNVVHVLDTGKIKYPQDGSRTGQAVIRKSSIPQIGASTQNVNGSIAGNVLNVERAMSPSGQSRMKTDSVPSLGKAGSALANPKEISTGTASSPSSVVPISMQQQVQSKIAKRAETPQRPRREGDEPQRTISPTANGTRAISPTGVKGKGITAGVTSALISPQTSPPSPYNAQFSGNRGQYTRSPSPRQNRPTDSSIVKDITSSDDGFYYRNNNTISPQSDKVKEQWLKSAVILASQKGFLLSNVSAEFANVNLESVTSPGTSPAVNKLLEMVIVMKQELSDVKVAMAQQASEADEKVVQAEQGRSTALHEAAFYRAKLAALDVNSPADFAKIDREHSAELESRLTTVLLERSELEKKVSQLESDLAQHIQSRQLAEEHITAASQRAEATESSYSRSLTDYAELQRRAQANEGVLQEHAERLARLTSESQMSNAELNHAKARLESADASIEQYLRTLEQTQAALNAANAQADEMQALWADSNREATDAKSLLEQLRNDLATRDSQLSASKAHVEDLERVISALRVDQESMRTLTSGSLSDLVNASKNIKLHNDGLENLHVEQLKAIQNELTTFHQLHAGSRAKVESVQAELAEAHNKVAFLERQSLASRSEIASLRALHAAALDDAARHRNQVTNRENDYRERHRAVELAEAKVHSLRSLLVEHGIPFEPSAEDSPRMESGEGQSVEQLIGRIRELETRLEAREVSHRALTSAHEEARRDLEKAEQRVRDGVKHQQVASDQVNQLQDELERARSPQSRHGSEDYGAYAVRAQEAENNLADLQERHKGLEASHMKAVQYVKGTEKMLRRMKEELNKHKARVEELEGQMSSQDTNNPLSSELNALRQQLAELRKYSEQAAADNESLTGRIGNLQADFDRTLAKHKSESSEQLKSAESALRRLEGDLNNVQNELDETVQVNSQLNRELSAALSKLSVRPGGNGEVAEIQKLESELENALNKAAWLQKDKELLESKLTDANGKISVRLFQYVSCSTLRSMHQLLLDAMERGAVSSVSGHEGSSSIDHGSFSAELERWDHGGTALHRSSQDASETGSELRAFFTSDRPQHKNSGAISEENAKGVGHFATSHA